MVSKSSVCNIFLAAVVVVLLFAQQFVHISNSLPSNNRSPLIFHAPAVDEVSLRNESLAKQTDADTLENELSEPLEPDVWAGGDPKFPDNLHRHTRALLTDDELESLEELCGRCLYHSLTNYIVGHEMARWVFVATGDINSMWIRDSAVQIGIYLPRIKRHPALRMIIEGAIRSQAFFILQDPYANAYAHKWSQHTDLEKQLRMLGRGGWVDTRNYELDSGAYFINLLYNYYISPNVYAPEQFLSEAIVWDAVNLMVDVWIVEQEHELKSPYRYAELERDGRGPKSGFTGMTWSAFRPSDDMNAYGYSIPSNMYAAGALERALVLNKNIWKREDFAEKVQQLVDDIRHGIEKFGIIEVEEGVRVYAYEVDGLGGNLTDFDDANIPSLLSIPMLGYPYYDKKIYKTTRSRILSGKNPWFFKSDQLEGIGSPHTPTPYNYVWPIALAMQGLTTHDPIEQSGILRMMLRMQCGNGLMHESVNVDQLSSCTREYFEWANALLVTLVETTLGLDCEGASERQRMASIQMREGPDKDYWPDNGGEDIPLYYENQLTYMKYDVPDLHGFSILTFRPFPKPSPPPPPFSPPPPPSPPHAPRIKRRREEGGLPNHGGSGDTHHTHQNDITDRLPLPTIDLPKGGGNPNIEKNKGGKGSGRGKFKGSKGKKKGRTEGQQKQKNHQEVEVVVAVEKPHIDGKPRKHRHRQIKPVEAIEV